MAYDFRANQVRLNRIISSGSLPILVYPSSSAVDFAGNLVASFSTASVGSDVFFFVSGSSSAKSLFGGDVVSSGSIRSLSGITGSLRYTNASNTPFIIAGSDITANYNSLGQWEITGSASSFFTSPSSNVVQTTGSLRAVGLSSSSGAQITGSLQVLGGITGSISGTTAGNPFIVAGPNITASYNALGQWEITGSAGSGTSTNFFFSNTTNIIEASGSLYLSGALRTTTLSASLGAIITGSVVQGTGSIASGFYSHAEGYQTVVLGDYAHAEGYQTNATVQAAHAEGNNTTASGFYSHAEGNVTIASGQYAHAEGTNTTASGMHSHTEGNSTQATDDGAHAEGRGTAANGVYSHAEGRDTVAAGDYSHAAGNGTEASAIYQAALGKFNTTGNSTSLFVVGDGLDSSNRHDILRVNSGSVEISGSLFVTQVVSASVVSASYVRANGINITPVTALFTIAGDGVNRASGSISGLFESGSLMTAGTVGKFDVEILGLSFNATTGASWRYVATALWPALGSFSFLASTEIAAEYGPVAGSFNPATEWDVNFNNAGQIELTGSATIASTTFYVQVTKKMILGSGTIIA